MFFNAHTYYSIKRNNGVAQPLRIFGSLLADSALMGVVSWTDLHDKNIIKNFAAQLEKNGEQLGYGLVDHYDLDLRSHDAFEGDKGYAFSHQTQQLRELVARACRYDTPEQAQGIAHNFIEAGVDINLLQRNGKIQNEVRKALDSVKIDPVAEYVAEFFKAEVNDIKVKLTAYSNLIVKYDLENLDGWVNLWIEIISLLLQKDADEKAIRDALQLAVELTIDDYQRVIAA